MNGKKGNKIITWILFALFLAAVMVSVVLMMKKLQGESKSDGEAVQPTETETVQKGGVILCFGDSNTWGYDPESGGGRYAEEELWTSILSSMLGENHTVINEGLNGRTTAFGEGADG